MKVTGTTTMDAPKEKVWEAFMDPDILVSTIPGCDRLEETGENQYLATVTAGVGSIKGSYQGKVALSNLKKHESLTLDAQAAGATGTIGVEVQVTFTDLDGEKTQIDYDADATVGGVIGGVGQRMLTSVSKRMASEFFNNVNKVLTGATPLAASAPDAEGNTAAGPSPAGASSAAPMAAASAAPNAGAGASSSHEDLFKGFLAGTLATLLGVLVGAIAARRR